MPLPKERPCRDGGANQRYAAPGMLYQRENEFMSRVLTWDEAIRLADQIAESADAGAWHARVAVGGDGNAYTVMVRQHCTDDWHYVSSMAEFVRLCTQLRAIRNH